MKSTFFVAALCAAGLAFAQAEPGVDETQEKSVEITEEDLTLGEEPSVERKENVRAQAMLDAFVEDESRNWKFGIQYKNGQKDQPFYVCSGVGDISAPVNSSAYATSRLIAYEKAMMMAKSDLAGFMGTALSVAVQMSLGMPPAEISADDEVKVMAQAFANFPANSEGSRIFKAYCDHINGMLAKQGINADEMAEKDPEALAKAREKLPKLATTEEFKQVQTAAANSFVQGLQAFYTVEALTDDRGEIGVVCLWSPKMNILADAIVNDKTKITFSNAKEPLNQQIPSDTTTLLSSFGVKTMIDENGELCLVSYGQASPRIPTAQAERIAANQAKLSAQTQIRSFVGEIVAFQEMNTIAEASGTFEDLSKIYEDFSTYQEKRESHADTLKIQGITTLKTWHALHPFMDKEVYGCICVWKPSNRELAAELEKVNREAHVKVQRAVDQTKREMDNWGKRPDTSRTTSGLEKAGGKKGGASSGRGAAQTPGRFINRGAAGDEDAF